MHCLVSTGSIGAFVSRLFNSSIAVAQDWVMMGCLQSYVCFCDSSAFLHHGHKVILSLVIRTRTDIVNSTSFTSSSKIFKATAFPFR